MNEPATQLTPTDATQVDAMTLVSQAVSNGAGMESIDKLIELVKFNDSREALRAFNQAFTAAQAEFPKIQKRGHVDYKNKQGGRTQYDHAYYSDEVDQLRPILRQHGLSFRHAITENNDKTVTVQCILAHSAGHSETASLTGPADESGGKNSIQAIGSSVTYLKRYTFEAVTGIVTTNDDTDGRVPRQDATPPTYSDEAFKDSFPKWRELIAAGKKTPEQIINTVTSKYRLTDQQKQKITDLAEGGAE